ncbi:hypothetical protein H9636_07220 [Ureibacillus sp. Re31]|uniref:Uncharacterized protein n=1 Tax=Ureibacillus galli TaxID=2762222 RepID=A0ABR8XAU6_9BACL|nr:hypothetical protein [Ureibacillus galli]MBD8026448.1 hypothetical protein [Ureibacillus galli]
MQFRKNGIPIDIPGQHKRVSTNHFKAHKDFYRYKDYATLEGLEEGFRVIATAPVAHPEFKNLLDRGYRVIETWKRSDIA